MRATHHLDSAPPPGLVPIPCPLARTLTPAILEAYDFAGIDYLVVSGGDGCLAAAILHAYPRMRALQFDRPEVAARAGGLAVRAIADRWRVLGAESFAAIPPGADAYLLGGILHELGDEEAAAVLRQVRRAMEPMPWARLLLVEPVLAADRRLAYDSHAEDGMLLLADGHARRADDFRRLLAGAGFRLTRMVSTKSPVAVIEAEARSS